MRKGTRHSYLIKARDDTEFVFFITLCGQHVPADSESALWIEEFGARWEEQRSSDLCLSCAREMRLEGAVTGSEIDA